MVHTLGKSDNLIILKDKASQFVMHFEIKTNYKEVQL